MDEEITETSVMINNLKIAIERDEHALEYQENDLRELKERVSALEAEIKRSRLILQIERLKLNEYQDERLSEGV